jgi:hypothetical protein
LCDHNIARLFHLRATETASRLVASVETKSMGDRQPRAEADSLAATSRSQATVGGSVMPSTHSALHRVHRDGNSVSKYKNLL